MFESLDETIKHDDAVGKTRGSRVATGVLVVLLSIFLVGGLYLVVHLMG